MSFATCVAALNLEPMRSRPRPSGASGVGHHVGGSAMEAPNGQRWQQQQQQKQGQESQRLPLPLPAAATQHVKKVFKLRNAPLPKPLAGTSTSSPGSSRRDLETGSEQDRRALSSQCSTQSSPQSSPRNTDSTASSSTASDEEDHVHSRAAMLRYRRLTMSEARPADLGLHAVRAAVRRVGDQRPAARPRGAGRLNQESQDRLERASRPRRAANHEEELQRKVRSLLNKVAPENLENIVGLLADMQLRDHDELGLVVRIIFQKALAEPHYCETYAGMVQRLQTRYPTFPPTEEGEKPYTFRRVLVNACQDEYTSLPKVFEPTAEETSSMLPEDLSAEMKRRKDKMLANMKFIGHLFQRELLAARVIHQILLDLLRDSAEGVPPAEHLLECACQLLEATGRILEVGSPDALRAVALRLTDLKGCKGAHGKNLVSARLRFKIQDLLDLRENKWNKKSFREEATTKENIRRDAQAATTQHQRGGQRPFNNSAANQVLAPGAGAARQALTGRRADARGRR